jgi:alkylhydroperoxidase family enzyme
MLSVSRSRRPPSLRIPDWSPEAAPRDEKLVAAILERRGGRLINLDLALLWSEPLARGWNTYVGAVRRQFAVSPRLKEIAICTVARLTGADYEFNHHWPEYVRAGGGDALRARILDPDSAATDTEFSADERLAIRYAIAMTRDVKVPESLFKLLRERFDTTELVELTAAIATYNMVARILVALEVEDERK